jgi:hypothetical protein
MNYFAHALQFLDRPTFVIGTSMPDMLSVVDRKMRLRSKTVDPFADGSGKFDAELAAGILQHLKDDRWFHQTRGFLVTSGELTRMFKEVLGSEDGVRCPFLGHIVTELQLDGALAERYPDKLDRYYERLGEIDATAVENSVNQMATRTSDRLACLIRRFFEEQFLRDYQEPNRLLFRLNQVMLRVRLDPLPDEMAQALAASWSIVRDRVEELLPRDRFSFL